ncbi:MAG TPA: protein-export chaperone SecB [Chromatiales bacterium]|nr:protein-export chaperone SecB [Chromatiales bacterium]
MSEGHTKKFTVERIFLKDLSFETPIGDAVFSMEWNPNHDINLSLNSGNFSGDTWLVVLTASITTRLGDKVAFLIEAQQAGHFTVAEHEREPLRRILRVDAPNILFPYLREIIDNVTAKGGFPSVCMQVPDFEGWHEQDEAEHRAQNPQDGH